MAAPKGHKPYPGFEKGGRPKKYTNEKIDELAEEFLEWLKRPDSIWFKDFCLEKHLNPDLLSEWAKNNERFGEVHSLAKHYQESKILKGGLMNVYNSSLVKLTLTNFHGWHDKNETKVSGDAVNPLSAILTVIDGASKNLVEDEE